MKIYLKLIMLIAALFLFDPAPAAAQSEADDYYRQWVDYRDGAVSLAFDQTPIQFAISAIHAKTGFQIVIPQSEPQVINLRVDHQPLEPAVRSVISTIGYRNFALLYDNKGRPSRAIVVNAKPLAPAPSIAAKNDPAISPLSKQERGTLQKDLEHWNDLNQEDRGRVEDRLKTLPESEDREQLVKLYGRQVLGLTKAN